VTLVPGLSYPTAVGLSTDHGAGPRPAPGPAENRRPGAFPGLTQNAEERI